MLWFVNDPLVMIFGIFGGNWSSFFCVCGYNAFTGGGTQGDPLLWPNKGSYGFVMTPSGDIRHFLGVL